ncbi:MAG: hypothetical protein IPJ66_14290 [Bacteroidetes bacterium]|nr:hypothetical protein [Bacteroidota bacterium]
MNNSENGFYITGRIYAQNAIFGNDTVSSRDYQDLFISKFDTSGQSQWVKLCTTPSGSTEYIRGESLYLDPADNLYVTGWFSHQRMVIASITLLNNSGYAAMFVAKFNSNGNVIWAKKGGSTVWGGGSASGYAISVDPGGDVYISGTCFGTSLYFDTSLAVNPSGSSGIFFQNLIPADIHFGRKFWKELLMYDHLCDASGAVYCTGGFSSSSLQFGSNILTNAAATIRFIHCKI